MARILKGRLSPPPPLRLYPTEAAAKKAGLKLADFSGERLATTLYALLPAGEKKPTYLLSCTYRLTVAEQRWAEEHQASVTKLGLFPSEATTYRFRPTCSGARKPRSEIPSA